MRAITLLRLFVLAFFLFALSLPLVAQNDLQKTSLPFIYVFYTPEDALNFHVMDALTGEIVRAEDKGLRSRVVPLAFWGQVSVGREGLEPSTLSLRGSCSNQLS